VYTLPLQHTIDSAIAQAGASQLPDDVMQYSFTDSTNKQQQLSDQANYASLVYNFLAFAFFLGLCGITYHLTGHIAKQRMYTDGSEPDLESIIVRESAT
jgi:ATP-binding cassette, subfamily A (ABC1), member 3